MLSMIRSAKNSGKSRVLLCSNTSFSLFNFRTALIKKLKETGFEVICVSSLDPFSSELEKISTFIPVKNLKRKGKNPSEEIVLIKEFFEIYRKIKPNIAIHFTIKPNIYGNLICGVLGIPSIAVVTGLGYAFTQKNFLTQIIKVLYKTSFRFATKVIFQNPDDMQMFIDEKIITQDKAKVILGSGVDTNLFSPLSFVDSKKRKFTFIFVGRLLQHKGIYEIVSAIKTLQQKGYKFSFIIVGAPDEGNPASINLEDIRRWENENLIEYIGFRKDVRPYLAIADVFVFPSYYREGIPRAILEAMAMGKPVITTRTPGCRETVREGVNGFLVEPRDPTSLALAMEKMINIPKKELHKMGEESRKMVIQKFDEKKIVKEYLSIIIEILKT